MQDDYLEGAMLQDIAVLGWPVHGALKVQGGSADDDAFVAKTSFMEELVESVEGQADFRGNVMRASPFDDSRSTLCRYRTPERR